MDRVKRLLTRTLPVPYWLFGLLVCAGIVYAALNGDFVAHYRLHAFFAEAEGVATGAPVRLDGVQIGRVERVSLAAPSSPQNPSHHIDLTLCIDLKYRPLVTTESQASLLTEGLLGDRYVSISRGFTGVPLAADAELQTEPTLTINPRQAAILVDAVVQAIKSNLNPHGK
jgi:phospholipid/cholesterol/gamma-HCH transport system substrate-binding protein